MTTFSFLINDIVTSTHTQGKWKILGVRADVARCVSEDGRATAFIPIDCLRLKQRTR